jgi:hypothetical protein
MLRINSVLTIAILSAAPAWAGELDQEFVSQPSKAAKARAEKGLLPATTTAKAQLSQEQAKVALAKGSELDDESPAQAYRGGWGRGGGGWGRGWGGWGRGWGGWGRGWGGWGRGWYGYRGWGWGRGWGGWGWGGWGGGWPYYASAWRWGWGWPYYASLWRPYVGYGYGPGYSYYPGYYYDSYSYCW